MTTTEHVLTFPPCPSWCDQHAPAGSGDRWSHNRRVSAWLELTQPERVDRGDGCLTVVRGPVTVIVDDRAGDGITPAEAVQLAAGLLAAADLAGTDR